MVAKLSALRTTLELLSYIHIMCYAATSPFQRPSFLFKGYFQLCLFLSHPDSGVQMLFFSPDSYLQSFLLIIPINPWLWISPLPWRSPGPPQHLALSSSGKTLWAQNGWGLFSRLGFFSPSLLLSESQAISWKMWLEYKLSQFNRLIKVIWSLRI